MEQLPSGIVTSQTDNIAAAADILRRMLAELEGLEVHCARLHFAMSHGRHAIRQRVNVLSGIAELLKSGEAPLRTRELCQRAQTLISHLARELEQLSLQTEDDLETDHLASLPGRQAQVKACAAPRRADRPRASTMRLND